MPKSKSKDDTYDEAESQRRFVAALKGSRLAGHKSKTALAEQRIKNQSPKKKPST